MEQASTRRAAIAGMLLAGMAAGLRSGTASAADLAAPGPTESIPGDRGQAIQCMTTAILHEAGYEPTAGQEAVAEVILNRVRNAAFPKTICGVVFQGSDRRTGCQFSFTCDGSMNKALPTDAILRARDVATRAIDGELAPHTAGATHYHADYVSPYWAPSLVRVASIGRHIFYRLPGSSSFSTLARYNPSGEHMPVTAQPAAASTSASAAPKQGGGFMPWGLSPAALGQPATGSNR